MSELISDKDERLAEFIRSKINLPNWSMTMAIRAYLQNENPKQEIEIELGEFIRIILDYFLTDPRNQSRKVCPFCGNWMRGSHKLADHKCKFGKEVRKYES